MLWNRTIYLHPQGVTPFYILVCKGTVLIGEWKAPSPWCLSGYWIKEHLTGQSDIQSLSHKTYKCLSTVAECGWYQSIVLLAGLLKTATLNIDPWWANCQCFFDSLIFRRESNFFDTTTHPGKGVLFKILLTFCFPDYNIATFRQFHQSFSGGELQFILQTRPDSGNHRRASLRDVNP